MTKLKRLLKFFLGLLLIPTSISFTASLMQQISFIETLDGAQNFFLYGIACYIFIHLIFFKPVYLYILGHEIMHVFATWLCGGKVSSFKVSSKGGSVKTSKSNFFISLSPYFFPAYVLLFSLIFGVINAFYDTESYLNIFMFALGLSLAFHFVMTIEMLKKKQPDIIQTGLLVSINAIYIVNLTILAAILSALFREIVFLDFLKTGIVKNKEIFILIFNQFFGTST